MFAVIRHLNDLCPQLEHDQHTKHVDVVSTAEVGSVCQIRKLVSVFLAVSNGLANSRRL